MIVYREIKNTRQCANPTTPIIGSLMKQLSVAFVACLLVLFLVMPSVHASAITQLDPPSINTPIKSGDTKIKGTKGIGFKYNNRYKEPGSKVTVVVKDKNGQPVETKTTVVTRGDGQWTATLENPVKKDYIVTAYQEFNEKDKYYDSDKHGDKKSGMSAPVTVQPSTADNYDGNLTMPDIEVWIEQTSSGILNPDEEKEILDAFMVKNKNVEGADGKTFESDVDTLELDSNKDIKVTFKDGSYLTVSTNGKITFKQITETSRAPEIDTIYVVDNVIKGKIEGEKGSFDKTKVRLVLKVNPDKLENYCDENKCTVDKDSSDPIDMKVNPDGTFSYTLTSSDTISLDQIVGVTVKDYRKFPSCRTKTVVLKTPDKVEVRDPKKLTDEEKAKIDAAIRAANTKNGKSKLPDGTGTNVGGIPAFIEFDKDGNVTIISPNDVVISGWDSEYNPIFQHNDDGSYKLEPGAKVIKMLAKDLVKNLKPKSPKIAVNTDTGKVTITPPAYENPGEDTDLASYTISYADKTVTITRSVDKDTGKSTWSGIDVTPDANTGVVTLEIKDLPVGATITATAKDNGGFEGDTNPLESDPVTATLATVEISYNANGGTGNMDSKKINKGVKYKLLPNGFTAPDGMKFDTWEVDGEQLAPGAEINADENIVVKAIWKEKDPNEPQDPSNPNDPQDPSNPNDPQDPNEPQDPNKPQDTDKVRIVAPQTGDVSILALCSPAILASVGMVALFRRRKEKR